MSGTCIVEGCGRRVPNGQRWCGAHRTRHYRGLPMDGPIRKYRPHVGPRAVKPAKRVVHYELVPFVPELAWVGDIEWDLAVDLADAEAERLAGDREAA